MEALSVLSLMTGDAVSTQHLPKDIARTVREAYGQEVESLIPKQWAEHYDKACIDRAAKCKEKQTRAMTYRIQSIAACNHNKRTMVNWFSPRIDETDDDKGQRAVRDTQETVEVMALCEQDGAVSLLPWIGDKRHSVECGAQFPVGEAPRDAVARLASQCSVRLPLALCRPHELEALIRELEDGCADVAMPWQDSTWLAGKLALLFREDENGEWITHLHGFRLAYSREYGLQYAKEVDN